jgi:hypothetical protein
MARLRDLRAAVCDQEMLILGDRPPWLRDGLRFWGRRVLCPLGQRPEPDLPESALLAGLQVAGDEFLILTYASAEVVPTASLGPLTRAGLRRAAEGAPA